MTISANVRKELFEMTSSEGKLIRIKPTEAKAGTTVYSSKQSQPLKMWTQEEHEKFLEAMEKYPAGPWKVIAAFIGSKTTRQTMTHAQKYRQKISRWRRGLRHKGRKQANDDGAQSSEAESADYSAKENLFKAIEYVSGDEMSHYGDNSPTRSLSGMSFSGASPGQDQGSELFRLAELASIEGMKQEPMAPPPSGPASPPDVEMADMSVHSPVHIKRCPEEISARASVEFGEKLRKMQWSNDAQSALTRPSPEWCTRQTEVRLSPLRNPDANAYPARKFGGVLTAITGLSNLNAQNRLPLPLPTAQQPHSMLSPVRAMSEDGGAFRLPPLNVASNQSANVFSIPPLRSKIDPSVLSGRAYYAASN